MAVRTTSEDVRAVTLQRRGGPDANSTDDFTAYIEIATILVDRVVTCAQADSSRTVPNDAEQEAIERYLAAHLWQADDQEYTSKKTERAEGRFGGQTGMGLDYTFFGQMAKRLDPSGCLTEMDKPRTLATLAWLGKPPSSQVDYVDRD